MGGMLADEQYQSKLDASTLSNVEQVPNSEALYSKPMCEQVPDSEALYSKPMYEQVPNSEALYSSRKRRGGVCTKCKG